MYSDIISGNKAKTFQLPVRAKRKPSSSAAAPAVSASSAAAATPAQAPTTLAVTLAPAALARELAEDAPRTAYRQRRGELKTTLHWNDRKLLLHEVEFLLKEAGVGPATVLYVGASPGRHIPLLSKMFPLVQFILLDGSAPACAEAKRIRIIHTKPTVEVVRDICTKFCSRAPKVLLISNMKASRSYASKEGENDPYTAEDLQLQMAICGAIDRLSAALLKLRLPYQGGTTDFAKGRVLLPVWGGQTSTETRLVPTLPLEQRTYDHKTYEEQLFHFNNVTRLETYPEYSPGHAEHSRHRTEVKGVGYDWRYDCASEVAILFDYAKATGVHFFVQRAELAARERRARGIREDRDASDSQARKRSRDAAAPAGAAGGIGDVLAHLVGKEPAALCDEDLACIVSRLSDAISTDLSKAGHTLATQPLTFLHEARSEENPYNQALRREVTGGAAAAPAPSAKPVSRAFMLNRPPVVVEEVKKEVPEEDKETAAVLTSLGVDLGSSDEEDDLGLPDDEGLPDDAPAAKRARVSSD